MAIEWRRGDYLISTDRERLDLKVIHDFLTNSSYWAVGRSLETVRRSIENSLSFGIYANERQIGFGRVVTDYATFAWIADVFILDEFRGQGLGTWIVEVMIEHPELQGFRRWTLATKDAHDIYRKFGFAELKRPERWMERRDPKTQESPDYWANERGA
ncbi:MAG TPA: GNAT family N-acetyltransferase [Pyrinomonadaceae bacterium]|nr:GNAT family N-acetyltransferase [Pyrinomonadaceae bacterium]